ncbi:histidine phosphatase family protein [Pseudoalteromonas sp. HL-AS2]|jgi:phosphohistidine phosphatase SixA|uniref:SixA phosphatase family protein n=1 Tax=Pseudoalteromonas sp. HL-AS2 TaxID=3071082 RepID=UPI002814CD5C|nr:histidine phosphatase family protein [Pseudoalteromonas sp. HL-AS2]WMS95317.1 histidine phosphatase family protein [Pseudoalteromonas sp. HL-AS2]
MIKDKRLLILALLVMVFNSQFVFAAPDKIYLFRHSEKQAGKNPSLTVLGAQRAQYLVQLIKQHKNVQLFSSNYKRTLQTAAPMAAYLSTTVKMYDAADLASLESKLLKLQGVVIVVGHSNTTPELTALLSKGTVSAMSEDEFSRYYILDKIRDKAPKDAPQYRVSELTMDFNH